jgi:hypothetical protein
VALRKFRTKPKNKERSNGNDFCIRWINVDDVYEPDLPIFFL